MEFKNDAQKETYEKVSKWLTEIFGEFVHPKDDSPLFRIAMGSALARVYVRPGVMTRRTSSPGRPSFGVWS